MPKDGRKIAIGVGLVVAVGAIILLTAAKKPPPEPPPGLANIYGKVTDAETGNPLSGVLVILDSMEILTNGNGDYTFAELETGEYSLQFSKEGYETKTY